MMRDLALTVLALVALSSCGQSKQEEFLNGITGISNEKAMFFSGDYLSGCERIDFGGKTLYQKDALKFQGLDVGSVSQWNGGSNISYPTVTAHTFSEESALYSDSRCTQLLATQTAKGTYRFGSENKEISLEASTLTLTAKEDGLASSLSSQNFCGYSDWRKGAQRDLLAGTCGPQMKSARYFINSRDRDAKIIDLILCLDAEMTQCQTVSYLRQ